MAKCNQMTYLPFKGLNNVIHVITILATGARARRAYVSLQTRFSGWPTHRQMADVGKRMMAVNVSGRAITDESYTLIALSVGISLNSSIRT